MNPETSGQISYLRLTDYLSTANRNDLIQRIEEKDWTVFEELYELYPKLTSTGDKDLEEETRNLAFHDIYNLARFTYRIVPENKEDIPRVIRMVISSIQIPEDETNREDVQKELLGLAEISKLSGVTSFMEADMSKIEELDWKNKPYKYPIEFCMDLLFSDSENLLNQLTNAIKSIDFESMLNCMSSGSDSD